MPGKVNPVSPELVNQVAFEIVGNDMTITMASEAGQLQLNAFEPIVAYSLFRGVAHLTIAVESLAVDCVAGFTAQEGRLRDLTESSIGLVAVFSPVIGYVAATSLAAEALLTHRPVIDIIAERGLMSAEQARQILVRELSSYQP